ncbi:MAG: hypothetical protein O9286_13090 [Aquidulcibacter sp.]|uniref:hypothetical protein n=1 Tax=Aquidulcibacter sp. TaxID=2052990 RepID=UPI0022C6BD2F|nr:hypothetical protein [Aquidulcibacter sp.]
MTNLIDLERVTHLTKSARPAELIPYWRRMIEAEMVARLPADRILAREALAIIEDAWAVHTTELYRTTRDWKVQEYQNFPGFENIEMWRIEGPLRAIGYSVSAESNQRSEMRQALLLRLFDGPIPPIFEARYLADWGRPRSPSRLQRIGDALCTFGMLRAKLLPSGKAQSPYLKWKSDYDFLETLYKKSLFSYGWKHFPRPRS